MSGLTLSLLGPFTVTIDDQPFDDLRNRPALALLLYLACRPERHRRESLMALLWPDWPQASAQQNLRQNLYVLRQALPGVASRHGGDAVPLILSDREALQLNPDAAVTVDARRFAALLEQPQPTITHLAEAIALYRGDFLADFYLPDSNSFEEWAAANREAYRRLALEALERLTNDALAMADYPAAERYARHQLAIDNLRESAHRHLMLALSNTGQRAAALTHYEAYTRIVKEELGIEATSDMRALAEQIALGQQAPAVMAESAIEARLPRHNLPAAATALIGRERELEALDAYVRDPAIRLVTIVGPGGMGKTRLAQAAAEAVLHDTGQPPPFPDGVYFVPLASLATPALLIPAIAGTINFRFHEGSGPQEQLLNYLRRKQMLLLLDNFEHLIDGVELVDEILNTAPGVKLLITSRQKLLRQAEQLFPIGGLSVPPDTAGQPEGAESDAVQLFLESARRTRPAFSLTAGNRPDVLAICRQVEGMPLGIILAATWLDTLSTADIVVEMEQDLDFLAVEGGDLPQRQRSMRAAFNHSWRLLGEREQAVFRQLSVFRGGFTREAAAAIADASARDLQTLINKSLLIRESPSRYMMHELLRQFAAEKLAGTQREEEATRDRHSAYFCDFLNDHTQEWHSAQQFETLATVTREADNAQAGLQWALAREQWPCLLKAIDSWMEYQQWQAYWQEGERFCRAIVDRAEQLDKANGVVPPDCLRLWVRALLWMAMLNSSDRRAAIDNSQMALTLLNRPELVGQDRRREEAIARSIKGFHMQMMDLHESQRQLTQSLEIFQELGDRWGIAQSLAGLGGLDYINGRLDAALERTEAAYEIRRAMGDRPAQGRSLNNLGLIHKWLGHLDSGERFHREMVSLQQAIHEYANLADSQANLVQTLNHVGKYDEAYHLAMEALEGTRARGNRTHEAIISIAAGNALLNLGQYEPVYALVAESLAVVRDKGQRIQEGVLLQLYGALALVGESYDEAQTAYRSSLEIFQQIARMTAVWPLSGLGHAAFRQGDLPEARKQISAAMTSALQSRNFFIVRALPTAALLLADAGQVQQAITAWSLAKSYPHIANSKWFADIAGRELDELAAAVSSTRATTAGQPDRETDLWAMSAALLVELEQLSGRNPAPKLLQ